MDDTAYLNLGRFIADEELDHISDASDNISNLNLFCLTSPHSFIRDYDHFYDRQALTEFIHGLY